MKTHRVRHLILATSLAICAAVALTHAQQGTLSGVEKQRRIDTEAELQSIAVVERKVMMPMRDGMRLATDIYRPEEHGGESAHRSGSAPRTTSTSGTCTTASQPT